MILFYSIFIRVTFCLSQTVVTTTKTGNINCAYLLPHYFYRLKHTCCLKTGKLQNIKNTQTNVHQDNIICTVIYRVSQKSGVQLLRLIAEGKLDHMSDHFLVLWLVILLFEQGIPCLLPASRQNLLHAAPITLLLQMINNHQKSALATIVLYKSQVSSLKIPKFP